MDRLIAPNTVTAEQADTAPATGTPGYATDGNPATQQPATQWPAYQYNAIQEELIALIEAGGLTPSRTTDNQVLQAIQALMQSGASTYAVAGGTANALTVNLTPAVTVLDDSMIIRAQIGTTNTGATTLAVNAFGALPVIGMDYNPLTAGVLRVGGHAEFEVVNDGSAFVLRSCMNAPQQIPAGVLPSHAATLGQTTGRLLNKYIYTNVGGTQYVSVNGASPVTSGSTTFASDALATAWNIKVQAAGAGGGGASAAASSQVSSGSGGGAGGFAERMITTNPGTIAITVGVGGAGGVGGTVGSNGGSSSAGSLMSATGGIGGNYGVSGTNCVTASAGGGTGTGGVINMKGGASSPAFCQYSNAAAISSVGGTSFFGGGGAGIATTTSISGQAASAYGSGGGGAVACSGGAAATGGAGAGGIVIIEEYA